MCDPLANTRGGIMKATPFRPRDDTSDRVTSAKRIISALLGLRSTVRDDHLRELLSVCLWKITEAEPDHKHRTRFRSERALKARARDLRHEHVFERSKLIEELLSNPARADEIADLAVACTVTAAEHQLLEAACRNDPGLSGWARYKAAGIRVIDMTTKREHSIA